MTLESSSLSTIDNSAELEQHNVHDVYNQIASHFSETRYKPWPQVSAFLLSQVSGSLGCDVGCGNGKYLDVNPHVSLIGVDRCPNLVSICKKKGFEALIADGLSLPFSSGCFDFALSIAVIHHFSTPERRIQAIQEILRILKPEGQALIYVWAWQQSGRRHFPTQDVLVPWQLKLDSKTYQRYYHVFCENELEDLVARAGGKVLKSGFEKDNYYCFVTLSTVQET
ncbi:tRNA methyltransferase, has a role in tRNA modification [Coelomomyces lativittatus]|nr:tRNA methyltransferase, has a role in tRNA modification [Coelomomyces lativittatus]KAJ1512849.1 tRNA methyltransferase, has a role in tRNA modification [Coelomomyces lativittatus]KAJ1515752.1 tRNA methyltransferase, has a role in tRNA modification [Coelomomyces lativittatus]